MGFVVAGVFGSAKVFEARSQIFPLLKLQHCVVVSQREYLFARFKNFVGTEPTDNYSISELLMFFTVDVSEILQKIMKLY